MRWKYLAALSFSLATVMGVGLGTAWADEDDDDAPAASVSDMEPGGPPKAKASSSRARSKKVASRSKSRRRGKSAGYVVPDSKLRTDPLPPPSGKLALRSLASDEAVELQIYNDDGSYNVDALKQVTRVLRCRRTDAEKDVEPRLATILSHIYDHYGKPLEVVSGFRNQRKTTSYHYKASASDIRIAGVAAAKLRAYVESLDAGGMGIGLYPRSQFIHVDVRPPPSYRWVDYSRANSNASEKRPPRGWKRSKKPIS